MSEPIKFRGYEFFVACKLFRTEVSGGVAQPFDSDIENLKSFMDRNPGRNRVMIDVGAHIGLFSIIYSNKFDTIYSFEPNKITFDYFLRNISLNNCTNIVPENYGISNDFECGEMVSFGSPDNSGTFNVKEKKDGNVKCIRLDDYNFDVVDFIKIDVEADELTVLQSAENILRKFKPFLQIEVPSKDVLSFLTPLGYKLFFKHHDAFFE